MFQIPLFNASYPHGSLVRLPAMVQDTSSSPELYASSFHAGEICGGWGLEDDLPQSEISETDYSTLKERSILWAVNIPGLASWCSLECGSQGAQVSHSS